jgi:glyceraldehyde-3-phosphate dehydrogenase (ferredoxin)
VCKKTWGEFKKDYEPYETMGPQCGVFDQRAAETLAHHADRLGFDAISVGGVLSWLLECLHEEVLAPAEVGVEVKPVFSPDGFRPVDDSAHNSALGVGLLDAIIAGRVNLSQGARRRARHLARDKGRKVLELFVYNAFARKGTSVTWEKPLSVAQMEQPSEPVATR